MSMVYTTIPTSIQSLAGWTGDVPVPPHDTVFRIPQIAHQTGKCILRGRSGRPFQRHTIADRESLSLATLHLCASNDTGVNANPNGVGTAVLSPLMCQWQYNRIREFHFCFYYYTVEGKNT